MKIKPLFASLLAALTFTASLASHAALSVDQSRYVFEGDKEAISIVVDNAAKKTYGGQTWIENIREKDTRPSFVVTPPFFKVAGEGKQVLRVIKALEKMPEDKESIYWVNLQEIPPASKDGGLSIALRTKVKLLYRPAGLMAGRKNAESGLTLRATPKGVMLENTTPYIFAIAEVLDGQGKPLTLSEKARAALAMFVPGDTQMLPDGSQATQVVSVDDQGHLGKHPIKGTTKPEV